MSTPRPIVVYTPQSPLRHPTALAREMATDLWAARGLAWRLMVRELRASYRGSVVGVLWIVLPPVVMSAAFSLAREAAIVQVGPTRVPYPLYVMLGTMLWQTFIEASYGQITALITARPLLARIMFPREAIVMAKIGALCVHLVLKVLLAALLLVWFETTPSARACWAPFAVVPLVVLGTGVGLTLAPMSLLYPDISRGFLLLVGVWLFLSPVAYPVPDSGTLALVVRLNPMTPLIETVRELATGSALSCPRQFALVSALAVLLLPVSWLVHRLVLPFAIERTGS